MNELNAIKKNFLLSREDLIQLSHDFCRAIESGLEGESSPLMMIPSYIGKPTGKEHGDYLAVDMGGTNVRASKFRIEDRTIEKLKEVKGPLRSAEAGYDFTSSETTGAELYDYIAGKIASVLDPSESLPLGHTFSFPTEQTGINDAVLVGWSKEISISGVEGENPNRLLQEAINRKGLHAEACAIINDTVGTLLVAACSDAHANIASIVGTGHNTCYVEPKHPLTGQPMIINMEAANFDWGLPYTEYDDALDAASMKPGKGRLEKMISGAYLGEVLRLLLVDLMQRKLIFRDDQDERSWLLEKDGLSSKHVAQFIAEPAEAVQCFSCSEEDGACICEFAKLIVQRAAQLVTCTYMGTIMHLDADVKEKQTIGIDGSIYEKMPEFQTGIRKTLSEVLGEAADKIEVKLVKDGSGAGAAVAAAMVNANK